MYFYLFKLFEVFVTYPYENPLVLLPLARRAIARLGPVLAVVGLDCHRDGATLAARLEQIGHGRQEVDGGAQHVLWNGAINQSVRLKANRRGSEESAICIMYRKIERGMLMFWN